ncbi:hypothetical protein TI03_00475 [Achromatium sp. WMS1]|nr:hypothetical protein TI03_00475 [Achromatium sp. WMS1]
MNQKFNIAILQLQFRTRQHVQLPPFSGSTWRGALGQSLRRLTCVYSQKLTCPTCILHSTCWYARLYEPTIAPQCALLGKQAEAPHPLIPRPWPLGGTLESGQEAGLDLILVGEAVKAVDILVQATERMINHGIGLDRGELELLHWQLKEPELNPWHPPALSQQISINITTPLRLRVNGRILRPNKFTMRAFGTTLLRRLSLFTCCHSAEVLTVDFKSLAHVAEQIKILENHLQWQHWARYSSSQKRHIDMDGVIGKLVLDLNSASVWWPYVWLGQWLHLGKGASMGMGRYYLH